MGASKSKPKSTTPTTPKEPKRAPNPKSSGGVQEVAADLRQQFSTGFRQMSEEIKEVKADMAVQVGDFKTEMDGLRNEANSVKAEVKRLFSFKAKSKTPEKGK